jgi:hypothetical protein
MEKEFLPYDLALRMKQLGFEEPCLSYYEGESFSYNLASIKGDDYIIPAPLYQQVFRWFRENGFLIHFSSHDVNIHDFYIKWSPDKSILSDAYDTYEEAELACLDKLIEIVEGNGSSR